MPIKPMSIDLRPINTKSVRFRTTAGAAIALTLLLIVAGGAINWLVGREIQKAFDATLLEQATDRATLLAAGARPESLMTAVGHEVIVVAISPQGDVLASAGTPAPDEAIGIGPGISDAALLVTDSDESGEVGESGEAREGGDRETLRVAVAVAADGSTIIVGNEGESARSTKSQVRNTLLLVVPLIAVAGAVVAWFVTGRALTPVKRIQAELDEVVHASDGRRVSPPDSGDEIAELSETINDVLDRLEQQSTARLEFVADASHELKSPLANARVLIDTTADHADAAESERVRASVAIELDRLQALVDDLLYLARLDETTPTRPTLLDLDDLLFDEAERVAARTDKTIDASGVRPARVFVDSSDASRAIRNLIENAERFATSRVDVAIATADDSVSVEISDDGPGIPAEQRDRVFERFTRLDVDRARSDGGTGLGLAIVASIAARSGGGVTVHTSATGGALFRLTFPRDLPKYREAGG